MRLFAAAALLALQAQALSVGLSSSSEGEDYRLAARMDKLLMSLPENNRISEGNTAALLEQERKDKEASQQYGECMGATKSPIREWACERKLVNDSGGRCQPSDDDNNSGSSQSKTSPRRRAPEKHNKREGGSDTSSSTTEKKIKVPTDNKTGLCDKEGICSVRVESFSGMGTTVVCFQQHKCSEICNGSESEGKQCQWVKGQCVDGGQNGQEKLKTD